MFISSGNSCDVFSLATSVEVDLISPLPVMLLDPMDLSHYVIIELRLRNLEIATV